MAIDDDSIDDSVSLRFKYGPQTVFLFVRWRATLPEMSEQLLEALRERYPQGLIRNTGLPDTVSVPKAGEPCSLSYALPKNPRDMAAGWKPVNGQGQDTPLSLRLRDNSVLAFVVHAADDAPAASEADFHVEVPTFEDDEE